MKIMDFNRIGIIILIASIGLLYSFFSYTSKAIVLNHTGSDIPVESLVGYISAGILVIFSLYLVLAPQKNGELTLQNPSEVQKIADDLKGEEKDIYKHIVNYNGFIFQNELAEKTGLTKVKVTRLLDKLEEKGLVERRRRGMNNIIILKNSDKT